METKGVEGRTVPQSSQKAASMFKRILVAVDGSDNSMRASKVAVELAQKYGSELIVLHVIPMATYGISFMVPGLPPPPGAYEKYREYERNVAQSFVNKAAGLAQSAGVDVRAEVQESVPSVVEGITEYARGENVDLIVIGTRGLSRFKKLVIGSVSSGVVNHAHCPVLVVR